MNPTVAELEAAFTKTGLAPTGVLLPEQAILLQLLRAQGTQIAELMKVEAIGRTTIIIINTRPPPAPGLLYCMIHVPVCRGSHALQYHVCV